MSIYKNRRKKIYQVNFNPKKFGWLFQLLKISLGMMPTVEQHKRGKGPSMFMIKDFKASY